MKCTMGSMRALAVEDSSFPAVDTMSTTWSSSRAGDRDGKERGGGGGDEGKQRIASNITCHIIDIDR